MREAIAPHIQGMIEDNEPIPMSHTDAEYKESRLMNFDNRTR